MPNTYFRFKKFTIHQEQSAMKVCTDSCLFGGWVASLIKTKGITEPKTIIDIGAGTGLLSLMLAQATDSLIHCVEKHENSAVDAIINCKESPWHQRLTVFNADVNCWLPPVTYDLIICNPPFFENDLLPVNKGKAIAKHGGSFTLHQLLSVSNTIINNGGKLAVLLPFKRMEEWRSTIARYSWFIIMQMDVKQTTAHSPFRSMLILQKKETGKVSNELSIKDHTNVYTNVFVDLLRDYYLHL